ncbi:MAG: hypothetical protein ACJAS9_004008 [Polaribacter sp.]|jgi:hypothetical protein
MLRKYELNTKLISEICVFLLDQRVVLNRYDVLDVKLKTRLICSAHPKKT